MTQILVVSTIALLATVGVYGIVALIVRMDEAGFYLIKHSKKEKSFKQKLGNILVQALPIVIKALTIIGTIALLLVSGGIFLHNIDWFHHFLQMLPDILREFIVGILVGIASVILFKFIIKIKSMV